MENCRASNSYCPSAHRPFWLQEHSTGSLCCGFCQRGRRPWTGLGSAHLLPTHGVSRRANRFRGLALRCSRSPATSVPPMHGNIQQPKYMNPPTASPQKVNGVSLAHAEARMSERRVPSPNRYRADAKFCFCKNNKRIIIITHADVQA
jgi:hypothetical protein